ncbi:prepilin peptidase [Actinotalea fermentans]|uniref:Prepilin leader peptidase/N-methyltransferase n=1 Tax=Actinotalea fermentans TaxID=43671 RepID=A0A511YUI4_9CELL|nr:A24 family peptidase [Actinotalea fermentans]GEN78853.1 prepilin peptidase [Actinotalea fermentans]
MELIDPGLLAALGTGAVGVLGLLVGSFLNVVIWRVPRGESVVAPPSACPQCGHRIRPRDNVPVLSWLLLRARCRDCGVRIPVRYPAVEGATALLFVLVQLRLGWSPALPVYLYLGAVCFALALIDLDVHRLPDAIVLPSYVVVGAGLVLASWLTDDWGALLRALIGGAALWIGYYVLMSVKPGGMGYGDVKLAGLLGAVTAWLGWGAFAIGAFAAFLLGGVYAIGLLLAGRAGRKSRVPFGPWMVLGAALGVAVGEPLWASYLSLVGLAAT